MRSEKSRRKFAFGDYGCFLLQVPAEVLLLEITEICFWKVTAKVLFLGMTEIPFEHHGGLGVL